VGKRKTCVIYNLTTTPHGYKKDLMVAFGAGCRHIGIIPIHEKGMLLHDSDYSLIFNYQMTKGRKDGHKLRMDVFMKQTKENGNIWMFDSDVLITYSLCKTSPSNNWVRVPFGNVYPDKAKYFNQDSPPDRWNKIAKVKNVTMKDWRKGGGHILICLNRGSGGYSAHGVNAANWAIEVYEELRKHTDRPIRIRMHPGQGYPSYKKDLERLTKHCSDHKNNCTLTGGRHDPLHLMQDIKGAHSCVIFTTTSGAAASLEGVPLFVEHPSSYMYSLRAGDLKDIENPNYDINRQQFFNDYGYSHWSIQELREGEYHKRIRDFI
tara:strand:- start:27 stop:986 length:960 start_codon:yes stop_codon:yes gene_type:complete